LDSLLAPPLLHNSTEHGGVVLRRRTTYALTLVISCTFLEVCTYQ
jgi:hypothetical protein